MAGINTPDDITLQSARSVWRQSLLEEATMEVLLVAICTERVEAKVVCQSVRLALFRCNLHGACGGKEVPESG